MKMLTGICAASTLLCGFAWGQAATTATPATPPPTQQNSMPASAPAQATAPAPGGATPAGTIPRIAPGSVIPVQLTKGIDAKKLKTGDQVEAKVTQDMKAVNGDVVVPKDTKVVGRVTEAQARNKEQKESQVGIAFDKAVMKTGGDVNMPMSIQAIIATSYFSSNSNSGSEGTGAKQAEGNGAMPQASSTNRSGAMGSGTPAPAPNTSASASDNKSGSAAHEPISGKTQGVLGIPNMTLSSAGAGTQGSVVTSDKNNVKLESGTLILLRVDQVDSMPQATMPQK